jgi:signal transduction histidine kinase
VRSLYLRIWLTVLAALALFALASGWLVQRHIESERDRAVAAVQRRVEAWADLLQRSLPPPDAPVAHQAAALREWGRRLRIPMALDDAQGRRIGATDAWLRRESEGRMPRRSLSVRLDDGRTLWAMRPSLLRRVDDADADEGHESHHGPPRGPAGRAPGSSAGTSAGMSSGLSPGMSPGMPSGMPLLVPPPPSLNPLPSLTPLSPLAPLPHASGGLGIAALVVLMFLAVAAGAWPVVRRLTRRLEALQRGVETFGAGALAHRVDETGRDEVAAVASSFNRAAARIEALVQSHRSLLANASHELRSPLARLKMAVSMLEDSAPAQREALRGEIHANIGELDALVEEVLLASRLDASLDDAARASQTPVDLLALATEVAARYQARVDTDLPEPGPQGVATAAAHDFVLRADERLLRRALRNLLENARRYGGDEVLVELTREGVSGAGLELRVCDRGPGVPEAWRERIFEPFQRLPGHAEREGGVGLGLSLVRQIAQRHGGQIRCQPREGGGTCFILQLPRGGAAG